MAVRSQVELQVQGPRGEPRGVLRLAVLPGQEGLAILLDLSDDPRREPELEPIRIVEGEEYRYEFCLDQVPEGARITTDRPEVFTPDTHRGNAGRLRPREYVGLLSVQVYVDGAPWGRAALEVVSAKLDYLSHFRWMLRDLAEECTELILERFSVTERRMIPDWVGSAATLYARFVLLRHLLTSDEMQAAIQQVLSRPHRIWVDHTERRPSGQGLPAGSALARQVASLPGSRQPWPNGPIPHIPLQVPVRRTEETVDTPENRFVLFALRRWRDVAAQVRAALEQEASEGPGAGPVRRGLAEAAEVQDWLDSLIAANLFTDLGEMTHLPANSQVLQKRTGYREIFRAFLQVEAAAALAWDGSEDVFGAGQRNVATLYEYWVYLRLARLVTALCDRFETDSLFTVRDDGLVITLKKGRTQVVRGDAERHGRRLHLELYFNKGFTPQQHQTWTVPMRPDMSLRITPEPGLGDRTDPVWLHFDAKYRVEGLTELFGAPLLAGAVSSSEDEGFSGAPNTGTVPAAGTSAQAADLLKMHAYRDAIRRSAGAYVIYPGTDAPLQLFQEYHEILPGLGAFALRPTAHGTAEGESTLFRFLHDVLEHVASQATQHERAWFWLRKAYQEPIGAAPTGAGASTPAVPAVSFLPHPPADTRVLLGYVRGPEHRDWIHQHRRYNLRADGRSGSVGLRATELASELVILYSHRLGVVELWYSDGEPELYTRARMLASGYPKPGGEAYFCLPIWPIDPALWPTWLSPELARELAAAANAARGRPAAAPVAVAWLNVAQFCPTFRTPGQISQ